MILPHFSPAYERWAPVLVRVIFGLTFLMSAYYKIPGTETFSMQVAMSGDVGIPFPLIAVILAFVLEVVGGIALVIGWQTRTFAIALAAFVALIAAFFYRNLGDQAVFGLFMSCVTQIAGLVYLSVYGAQYAALSPDPLPNGMQRTG